jgi:hypothetical protein
LAGGADSTLVRACTDGRGALVVVLDRTGGDDVAVDGAGEDCVRRDVLVVDAGSV